MDLAEKCHKARWWRPEKDKKILCLLCPRGCVVPDGKTGFCGVRKNLSGELYSLAYGHPVAIHIDPIEKKPLAEFLPGTYSFSVGTFGCNLACSFCQNYHLSRGLYSERDLNAPLISPEEIAESALKSDCASISFTYNEPTVWAEYAVDIAKEAKKRGLATVFVSNGYITLEAAKEIYPLIDAANIDMKGFSENFYRTMTGATLEPVLASMKYFQEIGGHLEITNLVIPGKNDSNEMIEAFLDWVRKELRMDTPLHFSAYHPDYKYHESPRTPASTLFRIKEKAHKMGFKHIYLGNI